MVTPDTLSIWLKEQAWPLGIVFALMTVMVLVLKISAVRRYRVLSRQRNGVTEKTFVEELARFNFDPLIAATTYRYLREVQRIRFPILASDALDEDLGMDSEDIDQTLGELLRSLGRVGLRHEPIIAVGDLVRYLQASPRITQSIAA